MKYSADTTVEVLRLRSGKKNIFTQMFCLRVYFLIFMVLVCVLCGILLLVVFIVFIISGRFI